jgi:hypothetical protein
MSVPLDRLYNFLDGISNHDLVIYRWFPHGSKKLQDLTCLKHYSTDVIALTPQIIFHDQEPLNFEQYDSQTVINAAVELFENEFKVVCPAPVRNFFNKISKNNIRGYINGTNIYEKVLLVHSEKNSYQVELYQKSKLVPVYYWAHAVISRDWYRYAELDPGLAKKHIDVDFLIYNRAWQGTREYRLKFAEMVVEANLHKHCVMNFSEFDDNINYRDHKFVNQNLSITNKDLEKYFQRSTAISQCSADYNTTDYQHCGIEVVLETLFDDQRIHLTEKILRPIACGVPFILASTPGSLKYLKDYGFKTFSDFIDESYDTIQDPYLRLNAIVQLMKNISTMTVENKRQLFNNMQSICEHNRSRFFSDEFFQSLIDEFKQNLNLGIQQLEINLSRLTDEMEFKEIFFQNVDEAARKKIFNWLDQNLTTPLT